MDHKEQDQNESLILWNHTLKDKYYTSVNFNLGKEVYVPTLKDVP